MPQPSANSFRVDRVDIFSKKKHRSKTVFPGPWAEFFIPKKGVDYSDSS